MMQRIYHWLKAYFKRKRRLSSTQIAERLSPEALIALEREVAFLRTHAVEVAELAEDESPAAPKATDPKLDAELMAAFALPSPAE